MKSYKQLFNDIVVGHITAADEEQATKDMLKKLGYPSYYLDDEGFMINKVKYPHKFTKFKNKNKFEVQLKG